jgi:hypothetical protein
VSPPLGNVVVLRSPCWSMTIYCTLASGGAATPGQSLRPRFPVCVFAVVSHLTATARLVRRVALCNSSMSVITQMLQRVVTMAQTAMAVVDNHRDAARTRFSRPRIEGFVLNSVHNHVR